MASKADRLPVIVGVGQAVDHWDGSDPSQAPHPVEMIRTAISRALGDTGSEGIAEAVDLALFIRTFPDSLGQPATPFGTIKNLPQAVLQGMDLSPETAIYSVVGGDQPQTMVNEISARLAAGECDAAVIAGGEVTGAMKAAMRAGHTLDWSDDTNGPVEDRGKGDPLLSRYEFTNGLGMPPQNYAAQEQAWRARMGLSTQEWRENASKLFARFSRVAATNPYAQFPQALGEEFLATPSKANYPICDPLLKWHVAQDAVNQSAALVLTTAGKARELGVAEGKWVYLHGHADVKDALMTQRPDLSHSDAIRLALGTSLDASNISANEIAHFDLYSCFPVVPMLAAEYLGLDPFIKDLTVTGGLPFFGGPGNNYSTHAIASMVERLRADRGSYGLVLANGGFTSKESVGIYSTSAPKAWEPVSSDACRNAIDSRPEVTLLDEDCKAEVEAFTVIHGKDGPASAFLIARNSDGRAVARVDLAEVGSERIKTLSKDLVGRTITIAHRDGVNFATL